MSVDRRGQFTALTSQPRLFLSVDFSPKAQSLLTIIGGANDTAWIYDIQRDVPSRLTFKGNVTSASWTADGQQVVYCTYLGGRDFDNAFALAVGDSGEVAVVGITASADFPLEAPIQTVHRGGRYDLFVSVLDPTGQTLAFSTLLGGDGDDLPSSIGFASDGSLVIGGATESSDFPLEGALQSSLLGESDGFGALPDCKIGIMRGHTARPELVEAIARHISDSLDNISVPLARDGGSYDFGPFAAGRASRLRAGQALPGW